MRLTRLIPSGVILFASSYSFARLPYQTSDELTPRVVYNLDVDSVVRITIKDTNGYQFSGTGFFVNDDLHVVTSYHVVSGAIEVTVEGTSGATWKVVQIKFNKASDLALLRLDKPSGRRPLLYSSLRDVHAKDPILTIGNPLAPRTDDLSTGLANEVRMIDGQTVLTFSNLTGAPPLGSPVIDSHGRVIAIERTPLQDSPDTNVGATVLGIGFLGGPIPWTDYANGVRESTTVADQRVGPQSAHKPTVQLSQGFAIWLNSVLVAGLRWQNAYLGELASNPPRDPSQMDEPYQAFVSSLHAGIEPVRALSQDMDGVAVSDLDSRVAQLAKAAQDLHVAEQDLIVEGQQADLERAARAATKYEQAQAAFSQAQDAVNKFLAGNDWYSWHAVASEFAPGVWGSLFTQTVLDATPSADRTDGAVIGGAPIGSDFQEGDVIDGLAADISSDLAPIGSWKDAVDYVLKHPAVKRFYVRVRRRGAHAMFYSRSKPG